MNPKDYPWTEIGWVDTGFAKGGYIDKSHDCGCGYPNAAPPCWHCTSCPECNCDVCDDFHNTAVGEICPELQFLNPILYLEKMQAKKAKDSHDIIKEYAKILMTSDKFKDMLYKGASW